MIRAKTAINQNTFYETYGKHTPNIKNGIIKLKRAGKKSAQIDVESIYKSNELSIKEWNSNIIKGVELSNNDSVVEFLVWAERQNPHMLVKSAQNIKTNLLSAINFYFENRSKIQISWDEEETKTTLSFKLKNKETFFLTIESINDGHRFRINYYWKSQFGHTLVTKNDELVELVDRFIESIKSDIYQ